MKIEQIYTDIMKRGQQALSAEAFEATANETKALILDTRDPYTFAKGFIPNAINIGIDGNFAPWVGTLIPDIRQQILLVTDEGREQEVIIRLARVGHDYTIGYLKGGFPAWKAAEKETDQISEVLPEELRNKLKNQDTKVLDVRKPGEFFNEHVAGALNIPLNTVNEHLASLDKNETYYVYCASGYRSMIFNSVLRARGFTNLIDVKGGFKALKGSGTAPVTDKFISYNT